MCVIISRKPQVLIPFEKIRSACEVNPDGYGISIYDRGQITTIKEYDKKGNNPDVIAKYLEDAINEHVYLHLRYTTAGAKDHDNCHPFQVSDASKDGGEFWFMHNGTMTKWKETTSDRSDSYLFAEKFLSPLTKTFLRGGLVENILEDPLFIQICKDNANSGVFLIYDNEGNELVVDSTKSGKQHEGWWSSNEYSFNRYHRTKDDWGTSGYYGSGSYGKYKRRSEAQTGGNTVPFTPTNNTGTTNASAGKSDAASTSQPSTTSSAPSTGMTMQKLEGSSIRQGIQAYQASTFGTAVNQIKKKGIAVTHTPPTKRISFEDLANCQLRDVMTLTEDEINRLVEDLPEAATLLILDLIFELYMKDKSDKATQQAKEKIEQQQQAA